MSHRMPETANAYGRNGHSQIIHANKLKIEDIYTTPYHSDHQIQHVTKKTFTIEGHPYQVTDFRAFLYVSIPIISSITPR